MSGLAARDSSAAQTIFRAPKSSLVQISCYCVPKIIVNLKPKMFNVIDDGISLIWWSNIEITDLQMKPKTQNLQDTLR